MITLNQLTQRIGVHKSTVKRWEAAGLCQPIRTLGGHRRYEEADVQRLLLQMRNHTAHSQQQEG